MKVYAVASGDYSSYHIIAVFEDKEKANAVAGLVEKQSYFHEYVGVEEYETIDGQVNISDIKTIPENYKPFRVTYNKGGDAYVETDPSCYEPFVHAGYFSDYDVCVMAQDEEHARKIGVDKIMQYRYEKEVEEAT